jgi:hypothetical protein
MTFLIYIARYYDWHIRVFLFCCENSDEQYDLRKTEFACHADSLQRRSSHYERS